MTEAKLQQIAANVLMCKTLKEAATQSGISDRTLRKIRKTADFKEALNAARAAAFERVIDVMCAAAPESAEQLIAITKDKTAPASARVAAARSVLDFASAYSKLQDVLDRISEFESFFGGMTGNDEQYEEDDPRGDGTA